MKAGRSQPHADQLLQPRRSASRPGGSTPEDAERSADRGAAAKRRLSGGRKRVHALKINPSREKYTQGSQLVHHQRKASVITGTARKSARKWSKKHFSFWQRPTFLKGNQTFRASKILSPTMPSFPRAIRFVQSIRAVRSAIRAIQSVRPCPCDPICAVHLCSALSNFLHALVTKGPACGSVARARARAGVRPTRHTAWMRREGRRATASHDAASEASR